MIQAPPAPVEDSVVNFNVWMSSKNRFQQLKVEGTSLEKVADSRLARAKHNYEQLLQIESGAPMKFFVHGVRENGLVQQVLEVCIPQQMVGKVIGKGGETINCIRKVFKPIEIDVDQATRAQGYSILYVKTADVNNMVSSLINPLGPNSGLATAQTSMAEQLCILKRKYECLAAPEDASEQVRVPQGFVG